jgi:hypothetical protein
VATSGVSNFDPTFDEILQDAIGMVGGGPILADELVAAQRGLDHLLTTIQNQNVLLHKVETTVVSLSASATTYPLDNTILDVLYGASRAPDANTQIEMDRYGFEKWAELPNRSMAGRPIAFWFDRRRNGNLLNVWPVPNDAYVAVLTIQKTVEDTVRAFNNVDVPRRFVPALIYGVAYWVGMRRGARVPTERLMLLKAQYNEALAGAMQEDRERGSTFIRIGKR